MTGSTSAEEDGTPKANDELGVRGLGAALEVQLVEGRSALLRELRAELAMLQTTGHAPLGEVEVHSLELSR